MKIAGVRQGSPASRLSVSPGDDLISINGHEIEDQLDYLFHCADEKLELVFARGDRTYSSRIEKDYDEELGLEFEPLDIRRCVDDCIFCFVHQNPAGARRSLLIKDEDYRHSFLHGNYITLDSLLEDDFKRILGMRLSPLYVSVHTTDPDLRRRMLRGRNSGDLTARLERLLAGGIHMHAQVVLVPGWNDGEHLAETVSDLAEYYPGIPSVAVVPVGLTDHRDGLTELRRHTPEEMRAVIMECEQWRAEFHRRMGTGFVFLSDEFFLASGTPLPSLDWYEGSCQEENGVGLAAGFMDSVNRNVDDLGRELEGIITSNSPFRIAACTGGMGMEMFRRHIVGQLDRIDGLDFRLVECANVFFGRSITTAGLLTARCFASALGGFDLSAFDVLLLPPNCTNSDGLFLDDVGLEEFADQYPCTVEQGSYNVIADIINIARKVHRIDRGEE